MNTHQEIFIKTKELLRKLFKEELNEYDEGQYLTIGDTGIWFEYDGNEYTIGYGFSHYHINPNNNKFEAIEILFELLTKRIKTTSYKKGNTVYKSIVEIEVDNSNYRSLGTTGMIFYPFWKKTEMEIKYEEKLIEFKDIEGSLKEIKEYA